MFHKVKSKPSDSASTRTISHSSWRDKVMLVLLTVSLGKIGSSAWNCGNFIWLTDISSPCVGGNAGATETIYPSYEQCGGEYIFTNTACTPATATLNGTIVDYVTNCNGAVAKLTPTSRTVYDQATTYSC